MKLLVTAHHGLERFCPECRESRVVWIGEDEDAGERRTCCTRCQTVIHREPVSVPFTTNEHPDAAAAPLQLAEGEVRWSVTADPSAALSKIFQR